MKLLCLGNNSVTKAVGQVMGLLGIEVSNKSTCEIIVMIDGDSYKLKDMNGKFRGNEKVIYLESEQAYDTNKTHPLFFLAEICETYRMPLEHFSIVELAKIINEVRND